MSNIIFATAVRDCDLLTTDVNIVTVIPLLFYTTVTKYFRNAQA